MKRKITFVVLAIVVISIIGYMIFSGSKPFADLKTKDIKEMVVYLGPPDITLAVNEDEIANIVTVLNTVVIYQKDTAMEPLAGQDITFTITRTDGTQIIVQPLGDLIIIDGVRYKTKYKPSEKLNRIANELKSNSEGM